MVETLRPIEFGKHAGGLELAHGDSGFGLMVCLGDAEILVLCANPLV